MSLSRAAELAKGGRFAEASEVAATCAAQMLNFGLRTEALGAWEIAGYWAARAGLPSRGLAHFERALAIHEHDLAALPVPRLVVSYLAHLPGLFSGAALAALDTNDPTRAVTIAEKGRCRALGQRTGRRATVVPAGASADDWRRYVSTWRGVVARALAKADRAMGDPEEEALAQLSGRMLTGGVSREALLPVVRAVDAESAIARLARADRPTAVLYSIRYRKRLELIALDRECARHLPLDPGAVEALIDAVDAHTLAVGGTSSDAVWTANRALLSVATRVLEPALARFFATDIQRLIWVPHASLVSLPLAACTIAGAPVIERAAVLHAASLTTALAQLDETVGSRRACAIEGRDSAGPAATTGGDLVVRAIAPDAPLVRPRNLGQLSDALRGASVVHFSCHGFYDRRAPLDTRLALDGDYDVTVESLYDDVALDPTTLVLFGACDSGTSVQSDLNEPLGLPMTMLNIGAQACIGAAWPVRRFPATAVCLLTVQNLAKNAASPEALSAAMRWLRSVSKEDYAATMSEAGHPVGAEYEFQRLERRQLAFPDPIDWGGFVHWGGPWRAS